VALGVRLPGLVEVRSGVAAGDTIVTRGQHRLSEGSRVELRGASAGAPEPAPAPATE